MNKLKSYENYIFSQLEHAAKKLSILESDQQDTVTLDIPLLIRLLELAREDIKDDATLHRVVDRMLDLKNQGTLTMDNYEFIAMGKSAPEANVPEKSPAQDDLTSIKKLAGL